MTITRKVSYDDLLEIAQSNPTGVQFEEIDSGDVITPEVGNKTIFLDDLDDEFKTKDSNGLISPLGGGAGGGGLTTVYIDHTNIPAELIRDRLYVCDFSGASPGTLTLTYPEGVAAENFKTGIVIATLADGVTVEVVTTNSQPILFPDASTDTGFDNISVETEFILFWDQANLRYVYSDDYFPTYANFTGSVGDVEFDTITVNTAIVGGEATDSQAGTVKKKKRQSKEVASSTAATIFTFNNLTIGEKYYFKARGVMNRSSGSSPYFAFATFEIKHNGNSLDLVTANTWRQDDNHTHSYWGLYAYFTATATTVTVEKVQTSGGSSRSINNKATLYIDTDTEETTDFT